MDELTQFKDWWVKTKEHCPPDDNPVNIIGSCYGAVLYRKDQFQVQLFIVKPHSIINPHLHPNVDSYEVFVSGDINFMRDGEWFTQNKLEGDLRIYPSTWHGGKFGQRGGVFLSVQHWLNGIKPTSVEDDWFDALNNTKGDVYNLTKD
jgi:quercetin dioxygenase-like cupin family protein